MKSVVLHIGDSSGAGAPDLGAVYVKSFPVPEGHQSVDRSGLLVPRSVPRSPQSVANSMPLSIAGTGDDCDPEFVLRREAAPSLDEVLFDNAAALKIDMSQLAMHLPEKWRDSIRRQIDRLLASQDWEDDSASIEVKSFRSFLRFVVHARPSKLPGLGVSGAGNLLAAWHHNGKRVSAEFCPGDKASSAFWGPTERGTELVTWAGHVGELGDFIDRIGYSECLR